VIIQNVVIVLNETTELVIKLEPLPPPTE